MNVQIFIVMGVSGCGKTTIGKALADKLGVPFFDGDSFHPVANVEKMSNGIPLTDEDRYGWLLAMNVFAKGNVIAKQSCVFACSALKESYRTLLTTGMEGLVQWVYLKGDKETLTQRLQNRTGHFMSAAMLESQLAILEEPSTVIVINIDNKPEIIIAQIMKQISKSEFGVVGMGVMGKSLARNFARNGVTLSLFNRYVPSKEEGVAVKCIASHAELVEAKGFEDLSLFVSSLEKPRKIFLMIKAGDETDVFIDSIAPLLDAGDILIDGGNSHYLDTKRRIEFLKMKGISFVGTGVSGGEKGALEGPSIMPSGDKKAYVLIESYLTRIAAKDKTGKPCCTYIGADGSGHFVKMIHNGIEYAEMQLLAEVYGYLRYVAKMQPNEISTLLYQWNEGLLSSYLLEITAALLLKKEGDVWLIDLILDKAGNKGTGNWATIVASELGQPATLITSALFARYVSTIKHEVDSLKQLISTIEQNVISTDELKSAYTLARIVNHQQGFSLIHVASNTNKWNLNLAEIARIWTNGCIIRSAFMEQLMNVLETSGSIYDNEWILEQIAKTKACLKQFCISAICSDLSIPSHAAALDALNALQGNYATANIIQAQRDYFGAHTYQKVGDVSGAFYHTEW